MLGASNDSKTILESVYTVQSSVISEDDMKIKNHISRSGAVKYLDENHNIETYNEPVNNDYESITGGFYKPMILHGGADKKPKEEKIFSFLTDIDDSDVKRFIQTCKLEYVAINMRSNSIFIIPDDESFKEIEAEINKKIGSKKNDPEGILEIKTSPLLYKSYILDVYGPDKNEGYEYRIDKDYPTNVPSTIYRRTSRNDDVYYIKLTKDGMKISLDKNNVDGGVECKFAYKVGNASKGFFSYIFKGTIPKAKITGGETVMMGGRKTKRTHKRRLQTHLSENKNDIEYGAYKFVADMIKSHGVDECLPCYSANMLHTAFAMINKFGENNDCSCVCDNADDIEAQHMSILSKYTPQTNSLVNERNIDVMRKFNDEYGANKETGNSIRTTYLYGGSINSNRASLGEYMKQVKNYYNKIMNNSTDVNNEILSDIATGIYNSTDSVEAACNVMNKVRNYLEPGMTGGSVDTFAEVLMLNNVKDAVDNSVLMGCMAKQHYPMLYNRRKSRKTRKSRKSKKTNEKSKYNNELELEFGDNEIQETDNEAESIDESDSNDNVESNEDINMDEFLDDM